MRCCVIAASCVALAGSGMAKAEIRVFRDGLDGYAETVDTSLFEDQPDNMLGASENLFIQNGVLNHKPNQRHTLIRFDGLFGDGPGQLPTGATITRATLKISRVFGYSPDSGLVLYELHRDFDERATWKSFGGGVRIGQDTAGQAVGAFSIFTEQSAAASADVTASITAWAQDPTSNHGWAILEDNSVGYEGTSAAGSSEYRDVNARPELTIEFTVPGDPPEPH